MRSYVATLALLAICMAGGRAGAQALVDVDLQTKAVKPAPPFDESLRLNVASKGIRVDSLRYGRGTGNANTGFSFANPARTRRIIHTTREVIAESTELFDVGPMAPNQLYLYRFYISTSVPNKPAGNVDSVDVPAVAPAEATNHFDTDFGVVISPRPGPAYWGAGSNVHYYLVPRNKDDDRRFELGHYLATHVSVFAGLVLVKLYSGEPVENATGPGNPVWGIGWRPGVGGPLNALRFIRVSAGMVYFNQPDANPLVDKQRGKHAPFFGFTADISLKDVFLPVAGLVGASK